MTSVRYSSDGNSHRFIITGHAGFCPGNDIVCAAISTLVYTLACALDNNEDILTHSEQLTEGYAEIYFRGPKEAGMIAEIFLTGFLMISERYPDNVSVSVEKK